MNFDMMFNNCWCCTILCGWVRKGATEHTVCTEGGDGPGQKKSLHKGWVQLAASNSAHISGYLINFLVSLIKRDLCGFI